MKDGTGILITMRIARRERLRWLAAATANDMRVSELMREAMRAHIRRLEKHRLLVASVRSAEQSPDRESA